VKVFISGRNGFLGRQLAEHFQRTGHEVRGSTSTPAAAGTVHWRLDQPADPRWLEGIEVLLHCAHDFAGGIDTNVRGTLALANAARMAGVTKQIFISSLSAGADAESDYGRSKFRIERELAGADAIIVRPGTIVGNGGLFGRMSELVRRYPVLPLIGGGHGKMYLISVRDASRALAVIAARESPAEFNLYYRETPPLRAVLAGISRVYGRKRLFVPFPLGMVAAGLTLANALGVKLSVDRDNLRGFVKSSRQIHTSNLSHVLSDPQSVQEALDSLAQG
jgi:uncharacterized protein YbjT (DUF2867 family)